MRGSEALSVVVLKNVGAIGILFRRADFKNSDVEGSERILPVFSGNFKKALLRFPREFAF
jgi:hypothetical protein